MKKIVSSSTNIIIYGDGETFNKELQRQIDIIQNKGLLVDFQFNYNPIQNTFSAIIYGYEEVKSLQN